MGFSILAFSGIPSVPFHPDESTYLYMSNDFDLLIREPLSMSWDPNHENDIRQRYRELDAPLTRYILGLGRTVAGLPALPVDWDWSASWEQNRQNAALPNPALLLAGRFAVTLLLPFSLILIFLTGKALSGSLGGLAAMLIMGSSALVLLHGRRAMAESALLFGSCLAIWGFIKGSRLPWLAGLGMALAVSAKQSTLPLLPVGMLAVCWLPEAASSKAKKILTNLLIYGIAFAAITFLLNPLLWSNPAKALQASWSARTDLVNRQVAQTSALAPNQVLPNPGQRVAVLIANLWIQPPSFYEIGNYRQETEASEAAYLENPFNHLFRGIGWGAIFLSLSILGIALSVLVTFSFHPKSLALMDRSTDWGRQRRAVAIVLLAGIFQFIGLIAVVPLPAQRYAVPMIPFVSLWSGFGIQRSIQILARRKSE